MNEMAGGRGRWQNPSQVKVAVVAGATRAAATRADVTDDR
jgi:hypothetical protein